MFSNFDDVSVKLWFYILNYTSTAEYIKDLLKVTVKC